MQDLVCISHLRWDFVWQRPQHLLSRMAERQRIYFVEEPVTTAAGTKPMLRSTIWRGAGDAHVTVLRLEQPAESPRWIGHGDPETAPTYHSLLREYLQRHGVNEPILWLYTPMAHGFIRALRPRMLIYDVMDQLSAFKGAPADLRQRDHEVLSRADLVFTGGISLYHDKKPYNRSIYAFPSGVETGHFARAAKREAFPRPAELAHLNGPILGYYGVIDERMDLELLRHIAVEHPEWNLVMVGPVVKIDPADLPQMPNIHFVGMRTYDQLPAYLAHFDVALVPFAMNESTRYLSPTKTLEYLAAGKPVVSTPIHDVIELYGSVVQIGFTPGEFIQHVEDALTAEPTADQLEETARLLREQTWDEIVARMSRLIRRKYQSLVPMGNVLRTTSAVLPASPAMPQE